MLWRLIEATPDVEHLVFSLSGRGALSGSLKQAGAIMLNDENGQPGALGSVATLGKHAAKCQPDVIQGWLYHGNLAALVARAVAPRAKLFWNIRQSLTNEKLNKLSTRVVMRALAACSGFPHAILYNSTAGAKDHERIGFAKRKRIVIPNGFNTNLFKPDAAARRAIRDELGLSDDQLAVGLIARYDPWKNHDGFLRMADRLANSHANLVFILAGKGVDWANQRLTDLIGNTPLRDRIFLLGDRRDVSSIDAALDIACNVSHGEGFPNAVGEAMACGIPCVATPVGASAELVGACGLVTRSTNDDDLVDATDALVRMSKTARLALGVAARDRILAHFSISAVAESYLSLYARTLTSGRPAQEISPGRT